MSLAVRIQDLLNAVSRRLGFLPPLLARFCLGLAFIGTGWGKLHSLGEVTKLFTDLGIPAPAAQAAFVSGLEFFGGILILIGLGTRFVSAMLAVTMVVAIATAQRENVHSLIDLAGLNEFAYLTLFVALAIAGAGVVSLDALIARMVNRSRTS